MGAATLNARGIEKLREYAGRAANMGVLEPRERRMYVFKKNSLSEITSDSLTAGWPSPRFTRAELFWD